MNRLYIINCHFFIFRMVMTRARNLRSLVVFCNYKLCFDDHDFKCSHKFDAWFFCLQVPLAPNWLLLSSIPDVGYSHVMHVTHFTIHECSSRLRHLYKGGRFYPWLLRKWQPQSRGWNHKPSIYWTQYNNPYLEANISPTKPPTEVLEPRGSVIFYTDD